MKVTRASFLALAALFPLGLAGCASSQTETEPSKTEATPEITLGTLPTEDILPMWAAASDGIFEGEGVNCTVQTFQSATELIAAVSAGEVDIAMTDPMVTASLYASGSDVSIVWVTLGADASQGRFGIMTADEGIQSLADLAGVEIGVGSNTILEYVMDTLMLEAGIPEDQILKAELQKLPVRYEAMASGQVKAAALPGSLLALGEASGFRVVADDTQGRNISQSVMIVRDDLLATDAGKAALVSVKSAWNKAVEAINAAPENYRSVLVENAHLSESIAETYPISTYPEAALPEQEMVDDVLAWMTSKGYLDIEVSYDAQTGKFSGR